MSAVGPMLRIWGVGEAWMAPAKIETLPGATIDMVLGKDQRCRASCGHYPDVKR